MTIFKDISAEKKANYAFGTQIRTMSYVPPSPHTHERKLFYVETLLKIFSILKAKFYFFLNLKKSIFLISQYEETFIKVLGQEKNEETIKFFIDQGFLI